MTPQVICQALHDAKSYSDGQIAQMLKPLAGHAVSRVTIANIRSGNPRYPGDRLRPHLERLAQVEGVLPKPAPTPKKQAIRKRDTTAPAPTPVPLPATPAPPAIQAQAPIQATSSTPLYTPPAQPDTTTLPHAPEGVDRSFLPGDAMSLFALMPFSAPMRRCKPTRQHR